MEHLYKSSSHVLRKISLRAMVDRKLLKYKSATDPVNVIIKKHLIFKSRDVNIRYIYYRNNDRNLKLQNITTHIRVTVKIYFAQEVVNVLH